MSPSFIRYQPEGIQSFGRLCTVLLPWTGKTGDPSSTLLGAIDILVTGCTRSRSCVLDSGELCTSKGEPDLWENADDSI